MRDVLAQVDAAIAGTCPCGAPPREGSIYCGPDCEPTHISVHTDQRESGDYATPMRWRPDLVTEADDSDLLPLGSTTFYEGRYHAQLFDRRSRPDVWHLRLDDGCRYVGADLDGVGDRIDDDLIRRVGEKWAVLERELGNTRHVVADDDPWADVFVNTGPPVRFLQSFRPLVNRRDAAILEGAGLREHAHFDVYPEHALDIPAAGPVMVIQRSLISDEQREQMAHNAQLIQEVRTRTGAALDEWMSQFAAEACVAMRPVFERVTAAHDQLRSAGVIPEQPPTDPMERALYLRRNRNTGPAAQPLDPRRRGRR